MRDLSMWYAQNRMTYTISISLQCAPLGRISILLKSRGGITDVVVVIQRHLLLVAKPSIGNAERNSVFSNVSIFYQKQIGEGIY